MVPLSALIENKVFSVHGGLSPAITTLDQIRTIDRKQEVPHDGAMCDLLWSDPEDIVDGWGLSPRGAGFLFGGNVVTSFNHSNNIDYICRAHQLVMEGYKWMFNNQIYRIAANGLVISIIIFCIVDYNSIVELNGITTFSSSFSEVFGDGGDNDICGNVAAILELDENLNQQFRVFEAAPHPKQRKMHLCLEVNSPTRSSEAALVGDKINSLNSQLQNSNGSDF
ncbi:Serine/threonine-protein phosphatase PP-X isozyme 2 [Asimina triloba]